jgi:16S rRNA processing protein RimM
MGAPEAEYLIVGTIRKPHGIRGELMVQVETDRPTAVFRPGSVLRLGDSTGKPGERTLTVERARPFKDGVLLKAAEHSRLDASLEALRGATLLISRGDAGPLEEDEVFVHELVGMRVLAGGAELGRVGELYEAPHGLLLGVRRPQGKELLVPFVREMVRRVDREARTVEIEAPAGLLDL